MTIDELNALQDSQDWESSFARYKPQPKKKKGFWQDQISTGGGMGGAVAGATIGTAILPGIGTLAGALLGGFAGGAAGQYAENGIVGEEDMSKDVLKEGLLNGVFGAGPLRVAGVGKALVTGGGREGVEKAITATPIRDMIANKTGGAATDLRRGVANTVKVADSYTQETNILDSLSRNGLKGSASKQYKTIDSTLGKISDNIDGVLSTITVTAPRKTVLSTLQKNAADALPSDSTYTKELTRSLERLSKVGDGAVGPKELFAFKKELGGRLSNAFNKLNKGAPLTVKEEVDMALWRNLDDQITKLAPDVKQMTLDQSNLITARPGLQSSSQKTLGVPLFGIKSQALERTAQAGRDITGRAVGGASSVRPLDRLGAPLGPVRTAGRVAVGDNLVNSMLPGAAPDMENGVDPSISTLNETPDMGSLQEGPTNPFGVSREEVAQQMMLAIQSGDTKGFGTLKDMYDMIGEYEAQNASSGPGKPTTVEGQKAYNNAMAGLSSVNDLEKMLAEDGSLTWKSSLPGGSLTDSLLGASQYETALRSAMDSMARLRTGAAMTETEVKNFRAMLPRAGDDPETIQYKLNNFRTYFNEVLNQPGQMQPSSLEEAMMGGL